MPTVFLRKKGSFGKFFCFNPCIHVCRFVLSEYEKCHIKFSELFIQLQAPLSQENHPFRIPTTQKTEPRKVPSVFAFLLSLFRPASRPKAVSSGLQAVHIFQDIFADFVARHAERDRQFAEQPVLREAEEFFIVGRGLFAHREARLSSGLNGL